MSTASAAATATAPGSRQVARPRAWSFLLIGAVLAFLYEVFGTWSVGHGFGGYDGDGGWVDADGNPTATAPLQVLVTGHPAAWVTAVLVGILAATWFWSRSGDYAALKATVGCAVAGLFVATVIGVFTFWQMDAIDAAFDSGSTDAPVIGNAIVEITRMPPG